MMKSGKTILFMLFLLASLPLFALRPGDKTEEYEEKLQWLNSTPMKFGKLSGEERERTPELRALVFFFCRAANSDATIAMLEQCRLTNAGKLQIAAITPDPAAEAEEFSKRHSAVRIRFAVDQERKLTPRFTEGSLLLPLAFLLNYDGEILWSGEAVDLAEAVGNVLAGKNDIQLNRKISPMLDEMQQYMRDGSEIHMANTAEKIFKIAPGHPTVLRMRLFSLENRGRIEEAMQLVNAQLKAAPQLTRLYFTALDLMLRYPALRSELPSLVERFTLNPSSVSARCSFANMLLMNFPGEISAIEGAKLLLDHTPLPSAANEKALFAQTKARLAYQMTDLDSAIAAQREALGALNENSDPAMRSAMQKQLEFFLKLKELRKNDGKR